MISCARRAGCASLGLNGWKSPSSTKLKHETGRSRPLPKSVGLNVAGLSARERARERERDRERERERKKDRNKERKNDRKNDR